MQRCSSWGQLRIPLLMYRTCMKSNSSSLNVHSCSASSTWNSRLTGTLALQQEYNVRTTVYDLPFRLNGTQINANDLRALASAASQRRRSRSPYRSLRILVRCCCQKVNSIKKDLTHRTALARCRSRSQCQEPSREPYRMSSGIAFPREAAAWRDASGLRGPIRSTPGVG